MTKTEQARALRGNTQVHYNCAQSVLIPFAREMGMSEEQAYAIALNFGGGMGCSSACGAFTGALMVLGGLGLPQEKREELAAWFAQRHSGLNCDELLDGLERHTPEQQERCDAFVAACVEWLCRETGLE